jgi:hypothetical protein
MGTLRGRIDSIRHKQDFPEIPGHVFCYDVVVLRYNCKAGLGTVAYNIGTPIGFRISRGHLIDVVELKILPSRLNTVLEEELEGEMVDYWILPKERKTYTFTKMREREPEFYDDSLYNDFPVTHTITIQFSDGAFDIVKEKEPPPSIYRPKYPWEIYP